MTALSIRAFCQAVYCAIARWDSLAPHPDGSIAFTARALSHGEPRTLHIEFRDVEEITRAGATVEYEADDLLELSVIEVEREDARWRVWLNPWYFEEIEFRCREIRLDDRLVQGEGRWLQDWLPEPREQTPR